MFILLSFLASFFPSLLPSFLPFSHLLPAEPHDEARTNWHRDPKRPGGAPFWELNPNSSKSSGLERVGADIVHTFSAVDKKQ